MRYELHGLAAGPRGECSARLRVARRSSARSVRSLGAEFLLSTIANDGGTSCLQLLRAVTNRPRKNLQITPVLLTIAAASTISPVAAAERATSIDAAVHAVAGLEQRKHGEAAPLISVAARELASFDRRTKIEALLESVVRRVGTAPSVASVSNRSPA